MKCGKFVLFAVCVLVAWAGFASAGFTIADHGAVVDLAGSVVNFSIEFSEEPELFTFREYGRLVHSFEYRIDSEAGSVYPGDSGVETLISGGEAYLTGSVPIRDRWPDPSIVSSAPWGPTRGYAGFDLSDRILSFSVAFDLLEDDDGMFSYRLLAVNNGRVTDYVYGFSEFSSVPAVPVPGAGVLTIIGVGVIGTWLRRK